MPYLGQSPSKGDENNFKILDDISSYTLTFDGSDASVVSAANDTITSLTHRFVQGQRVTYNKGGGTVITGLSDGVYYIIKHDHNTIKLATSASNAANGIAVNITNVGSGSSHTLNVAFDGVNTKFKATHTNGQKAKITRSAQLVISINGVIQQPHDSATPSTGFGFDLDGTIVFSQAPVVGDIYWAHVLTNNNVTFDISDNDVDNFTGNGSTVSFNLSKTPPDNRNVLVTIDGVVQYPNDPDGTVRAYTVVENVLTFAVAPAANVQIQVRHIGFAGSTTGGVTNFYGRTGSVVLTNSDNITVNDAAITGNATITGDLTINGTTTTLDTNLIDVDKIEVATAGTNVAVAVTHNGTGDLIRLYDGTSQVVTVDDEGNIGIGSATPNEKLDVVGISSFTGDVFFKGATSGRDMFWDESANELRFQDNAGIYVGNNRDAFLAHDGSSTRLQDTYGHLFIGGNLIQIKSGNLSEEYIRMDNTSKEVKLFHNSQQKMNTIGTGVSVTGALTVEGSTAEVRIQHAGNGSYSRLISNSNNELQIYTGGGPNLGMTIDGSQRVGIGLTNPTERLTVYGTASDTTPILGLRSGNNHATTNNGAQIAFGHAGINHYQHFIHTRHNGSNSSNAIDFYVCDGTQQNTVTSGSVHTLSMVSGKVGVATDNPGGTLDVLTSMGRIKFNNSGSIGSRIDFANADGTVRSSIHNYGGSNEILALNSSSSIQFNIANSTKIILASNGRLGIGTDSPTTLIDVLKTSNNALIKVRCTTAGAYFEADSASSGYSGLKLSSSGTQRWLIGSYGTNNFTIKDGTSSGGAERFTIVDGTGLVGIGSAIPANALDVQGTTHTKIHVGTTGTGHATGIQINHAKGNAALQEWQLQTDGSADGNLIVRNATTGTSTMFFDADNNYVGINETSPIHQLSIGINTTTAWDSTKNISNTTNNDFIALNVDNHNSGSNPEVGIMLQAGASGSGQFTINCRKSALNSADLIFRTRSGGTASKEVLRINSSGQLSIGGNSSVGTKVHVENSSGDAHIRLRGSANCGVLYTRHSDGALIGYTGSGNAVNLGSSNLGISASLSGGNIIFQTGGTASSNERLRIASKGGHKITCAETYYAANLSECNSNNLALNINQTRQGQTKGIAFGAIGSATSNTGIQAYDTSNNSANQLLINPFGGFVGINETSPDNALHVKSTTDTQQIKVENTATSGRAQIKYFNPHADWQQGIIGGTTDGDFITYTSQARNARIYTNNTERLRVKSNGQVIVGNVSNTSGNTNSALLIESGGMSIASNYDFDDVSGSAPHLTLSGQSTRVRLDFGTMNGAPYAAWIQARYDNNPFGNSGTDKGREPLALNPRGGVVTFNLHNSNATSEIGGGGAGSQGGIVMRAGRANSSTVNNASTAIKIFPGEVRAYSGSGGSGEQNQGTKYGGIAWNVLDPHHSNWGTNHDGHHCWMGMSLHSTPGQEFSNWQVQMNSNSTAGSYATNVAIQANPEGYITKPNHPSFHVGSPNNSGSSGGQVWKSHSNAIYSNNGNHYDNSTGRFTAPIAGTYFFFHWGMTQSNSASTADVYSRKNGSRDQIGTSYNSNSGGTNGYHQFGCSYVRVLAKNDYVDVYTGSGSIYYTTDGRHGGWGGYLIG